MYRLKNYLLLSILFFLFGCKNEESKKENQESSSTVQSSADSIVSTNAIPDSNLSSQKASSAINSKICKLHFGGGNTGSYQVEIAESGASVTYRYFEFINKEKVTIQNGKIYVSKKNYPDYPRELNQVYMVKGASFYAYNPESDEYDIYPFNREKSSCDLKEAFK